MYTRYPEMGQCRGPEELPVHHVIGNHCLTVERGMLLNRLRQPACYRRIQAGSLSNTSESLTRSSRNSSATCALWIMMPDVGWNYELLRLPRFFNSSVCLSAVLALEFIQTVQPLARPAVLQTMPPVSSVDGRFPPIASNQW